MGGDVIVNKADSGALPTIDYRPQWPQRMRVGSLLVTVFMTSMAVFMMWGVTKVAAEQDTAAIVIFGAGAFTLAGASIGMLSVTGFRSIGLSRRITKLRDDIHGNGVLIPSRQAGLIFLIVTLASCGVGGLAGAFVNYFGVMGSEMHAVQREVGGAVYLGVLGGLSLVAGILVLVCSAPTVVSIFPTGIRRQTRRWRAPWARRIDVFLRWDDINELVPGVKVIDQGIEIRNPLIHLETVAPIPKSARITLDTENRITLFAHNLVSEPNMLLALLQFLKDNPDQRHIVSHADAPGLLTPPPLRERFRAARAARAAA